MQKNFTTKTSFSLNVETNFYVKVSLTFDVEVKSRIKVSRIGDVSVKVVIYTNIFFAEKTLGKFQDKPIPTIKQSISDNAEINNLVHINSSLSVY